MNRLLSRFLAACLLACAAAVGGLLGGTAATAADGALLRLAHLSPDTPAVDVVVAGAGDVAAEFDGTGYGDVSGYAELPTGRYTVGVRRAGAPPGSPAVLSRTIRLSAGSARTLTLTGSFAELALAEVDDDLSRPPEGEGRIRVLDGTSGVVVRLPDGTALSGPVTVPAGQVPVRVLPADGPASEVTVDVAGGATHSLLVLEGPDGGLRVRTMVDAAGAAVTPTGGVDAGGGPAPGSILPLVLVGLLGAAARLRRIPAPRAVVAVTAAAGLLCPLVAPAPTPAGAAPAATPQAALERPAGGVAVPLRVRMPALGLDAPLVAVRTRRDGTLAPPDSATTGGWFAGGARPGETGPAVLAGHVDWAGEQGSFARLAQAGPGDGIVVERADGTEVRFTVTGVMLSAKEDFPSEAVYGPTAHAELRLITCGGPFEDGSYRDNVIVIARPA